MVLRSLRNDPRPVQCLLVWSPPRNGVAMYVLLSCYPLAWFDGRQRLPWRPLLPRHPILNDTIPVRVLPRVRLLALPCRLHLRCKQLPRQVQFLFLATTVGNDEHQTLDPIQLGILDRTSTTSKRYTICHQPTSSLTMATSP